MRSKDLNDFRHLVRGFLQVLREVYIKGTPQQQQREIVKLQQIIFDEAANFNPRRMISEN